ncbi:MAG: MFS transporter [Acidobacteria bacterium]|nr:MFS transporter [Acidobacteriota bacterium]
MEVLRTAQVQSHEERQRYSYWCFRIFVAAWIGYAGFYLCRRNISWTPLPSSGHSGWMDGLANLLMVFSAGYVIGQFVGGWATDKYGARRTVLVGGMLSLISTALLTTNPPVAVILPLQALNGFGQSFGWPAIMKLLRVWLPQRQFAVGVAWWSTSYALGSFLATALATGLSTVEFIPMATGSKLSILVPCAVLFLTTVFFYVRVKDFPTEAGFGEIEPQVHPSASRIEWMPVLRNAEIQLLAVMYFFLKLTRYALLFWLPLYIIETQHSRGNSALALSSLFELTGFMGAIFACYASDRWFGSRRYPAGAGMLFLAAFVFLLHPLVSSWGTVPTGISIALIGMLIFGPDVLVSSVAVVEAVPSEQAGRAAGYVNGIGSLGQMVSPVLVTYSTRFFGWDSIFSIFVVCSLIAASLLVLRWNSPFPQKLTAKPA